MFSEPKQHAYWLKDLADGHAHRTAEEATHDPVLALILDQAPTATQDEVFEALVAAARSAVFATTGSDAEQEALAHLGYLLATHVDTDRTTHRAFKLAARYDRRPSAWHERLTAAWLGLRYGFRTP